MNTFIIHLKSIFFSYVERKYVFYHALPVIFSKSKRALLYWQSIRYQDNKLAFRDSNTDISDDIQFFHFSINL